VLTLLYTCAFYTVAIYVYIYNVLHTSEEIRSHAKMLSCTHVVGYREATTIHDDVCIMAATGTAVVLRNLQVRLLLPMPLSTDYSNAGNGNIHQSSSHTNNSSSREYSGNTKRRTRSVSITSSNSARRGDGNGQMSRSSSANTSSKSLHRQSSSDDIAVSYEERSRQR
jgi:hypothetical protein